LSVHKNGAQSFPTGAVVNERRFFGLSVLLSSHKVGAFPRKDGAPTRFLGRATISESSISASPQARAAFLIEGFGAASSPSPTFASRKNGARILLSRTSLEQ
jgi:hypothetical protein